jgi:hypothetical protein
MMGSPTDSLPRTLSYPGGSRQTGFVEEQQGPAIKSEPQTLSSNGAAWNLHRTAAAYSNSNKPPVPGSGEVNFGTDVDTLMKAIQSKVQQSPGKPQQNSPIDQSKSVLGSPGSVPVSNSHGRIPHSFVQERKQRLTSRESQEEKSTSKKRYECEIPGCNKSFYQKTHLEIHVRAHTGVKPYVSIYLDCAQSMSSLWAHC